MRIIFFGTPTFAVPTLRALLDEGANVVAVVTQPDRPQGRSRSVLVAPPIKDVALSHDLPVLQPDKPTGDLFAASLRRLDPELGIVVAYGHILRPELLSIPRMGMINIHASLLPRHRGAAPIQHAILAGDATTGVTIMQMHAGMDTGPMLNRAATPIGEEETSGTLTERLATLGATVLIEALALLRLGQLLPVPQDDQCATMAPKIDRALARIRWGEPAEAVGRRIRAFDPAPGAWTTLDGHEVKLFQPRPELGWGSVGTVLHVGETLTVATGAGVVRVAEVQPAGKKRMPVSAWVAGRGVAEGQRFA